MALCVIQNKVVVAHMWLCSFDRRALSDLSAAGAERFINAAQCCCCLSDEAVCCCFIICRLLPCMMIMMLLVIQYMFKLALNFRFLQYFQLYFLLSVLITFILLLCGWTLCCILYCSSYCINTALYNSLLRKCCANYSYYII